MKPLLLVLVLMLAACAADELRGERGAALEPAPVPNRTGDPQREKVRAPAKDGGIAGGIVYVAAQAMQAFGTSRR